MFSKQAVIELDSESRVYLSKPGMKKQPEKQNKCLKTFIVYIRFFFFFFKVTGMTFDPQLEIQIG